MAETLTTVLPPELQESGVSAELYSDPPVTVYRKALTGWNGQMDVIRNGKSNDHEQWKFTIPAADIQKFERKFQVIFMAGVYYGTQHDPKEFRAEVEMTRPIHEELWNPDQPLPLPRLVWQKPWMKGFGPWEMVAELPELTAPPADPYVIALHLENLSKFELGYEYIAVQSIELRFTPKHA